MSSIGSTWKDDAVVDTCKKNQVVTETQQIREIYLQIFTKEEIPFEEKFSLKMKRDDYVNVSLFERNLNNFLFIEFKLHCSLAAL